MATLSSSSQLKSEVFLPVISRTRRYALVGSPNSGKSTLFNALTGLRAKVANYPGVTVERLEGISKLPGGEEIELVDLPGVYSSEALSVEEHVTMKVLRGQMQGCPPVDGIIFVADATSLPRSLPLLGSFLKLGLPVILALTMVDEIKARGGAVRPHHIQELLGIPAVGIVGNKGIGIDDLKAILDSTDQIRPAHPRAPIPDGIEERFIWADTILDTVYDPPRVGTPLTDRVDSVLLHPILGVVVFALVMTFFFQAIFAWAAPLQDFIEGGVGSAGTGVGAVLPDGLLQSILVDGVIAGVGSVIVFIPQIAMLFVLLTLLEQIGYMSRAVFLIDRMMGWVGLDGRSFVAWLSSYACAIPGIMAARSIPDPRNRLSTILVSPFMTCSARIPVYTLLIAAFVPSQRVLGILNLQGLVMMGLYFLGASTALIAATFLRRGLLRGRTVPFYVELPPYRMPTLRTMLRGVWSPVYRFIRRAGTIILLASLLLWVLLSFPRVEIPSSVATQGEQAVASYQLQHSAAGQIGRLIEPVFEPLGFDWKVTVGLVASLAAREVIVATLGQIYATETEADNLSQLSQILPTQLQTTHTGPEANAYSLATALSLLIFFVFALQCVSTLAVMRRETGSIAWPVAAFLFMFILAYSASFLTYRLTIWMAL